MRRRNAVKATVFIILFLVFFRSTSRILISCSEYSYPMIAKFYDEHPDSLDAVYIGASGVFASWCAPLAWEKYGITVWSFASTSQPLSSAKYLIEEARKTQPDAVYIIALNFYSATPKEVPIHNIVDYMPLSLTKIKLTNSLTEKGGFPLKDSMEFYVPLIRYHSRWNALTREDFIFPNGNLKSGCVHSTLNSVSDITDGVYSTTDRAELPRGSLEVLEDLFSYCKSEQLQVMFVFTPTFDMEYDGIALKNTVIDLCNTHGFEVMDQAELRDEIGLDMQRDFFNYTHTNVHGAIKVTNYLAQYLIERYDFKDKRGEQAYSSWDRAYEDYTNIIAPYVLDVEWQGNILDGELSAPVLTDIVVEGTSVVLSWEAVEGASGYRVYRKTKGLAWEAVATVDENIMYYTDVCDISGSYTYTVIPFQERDGIMHWGCYDYTGISVEVQALEEEV